MIIECDKCKRRFNIDDSRIAPPGSKVRCSECGHISYVEKTGIFGTGAPDPAQSFLPPKETEIEEPADEVQGFEFRYPIVNERTKKPEEEEGHQGGQYAEPPAGDGGNWEKFVNISKTEKDPDDFRIKDNHDIRKQESEFNWEGLRINDEPVEAVSSVPRMFEDEGFEGDGLDIMRDEGIPHEPETYAPSREEPSRERVYPGTAHERLSVDMGVLSGNPHAATGYHAGQRPSIHDSFRVHSARSKSGGGVFARLAYTLLAVIVFCVIVASAYIILLNSGVIPKESAAKVERLVESLVPASLGGHSTDEVRITAHSGKWLDTRNGPMYVITGAVTNESAHAVNYIKIKSEFISEGQVVYDNVVYAGNTFTENELKVSALGDTLLKLKKRSGNIDFYNPEKLAGLDTNIQPGESVPFYSVFPASERMLGLKYNLEVADYEDSP